MLGEFISSLGAFIHALVSLAYLCVSLGFLYTLYALRFNAIASRGFVGNRLELPVKHFSVFPDHKFTVTNVL